MKKLVVYGLASKKTILELEVSYRDYEFTLMDLLLKNGIPVASSCGGDGICKKCTVTINGEKELSCQKTVRNLFREADLLELTFSYL